MKCSSRGWNTLRSLPLAWKAGASARVSHSVLGATALLEKNIASSLVLCIAQVPKVLQHIPEGLIVEPHTQYILNLFM